MKFFLGIEGPRKSRKSENPWNIPENPHKKWKSTKIAEMYWAMKISACYQWRDLSDDLRQAWTTTDDLDEEPLTAFDYRQWWLRMTISTMVRQPYDDLKHDPDDPTTTLMTALDDLDEDWTHRPRCIHLQNTSTSRNASILRRLQKRFCHYKIVHADTESGNQQIHSIYEVRSTETQCKYLMVFQKSTCSCFVSQAHA